MHEGRRLPRTLSRLLIRVLGAAGLVMAGLGALGISAGSAAAASLPPVAGPVVFADAAPSPTCPTVTVTVTETQTSLPPAIQARGVVASCQTCPTPTVTVTTTVTLIPGLAAATDACASSSHQVAPTSVNGGIDAGAPGRGSSWPGWALAVGIALLAVSGFLFSALGERGRRQA